MTIRFSPSRWFAGTALALFCFGAQAVVALPPADKYVTFDFRGTCSDCQGVGVGHLTLKNFSIEALSASSFNGFANFGSGAFVSFTYDGTPVGPHYLPAYTIDSSTADHLDVYGYLKPGSATTPTAGFLHVKSYFDGTHNGHLFNAYPTGNWDTGAVTTAYDPFAPQPAVVISDFGTAGTFVKVPEPGTLATAGLGLLLLVATRRRRISR